MADLNLTAVIRTSGTQVLGPYIAGEALTAGDAVYLDANDGKAYLATAAGTKAQADVIGLAATGSAADNEVVVYRGIVDVSGATEGLIYVLSGATAGLLSPHTDATTPASTEFTTVVSVAETATRFHVFPIASGGQVA